MPAGFNEHKTPLPEAARALADITAKVTPSKRLAAEAKGPKAARQLGTLGGGNHFLELLHDEEGGIWIMLHSGSRNIGAMLVMLRSLHLCPPGIQFHTAGTIAVVMQYLNSYLKRLS